MNHRVRSIETSTLTSTTTRPDEIFKPLYNFWPSSHNIDYQPRRMAPKNYTSELSKVADVFQYINLKASSSSPTPFNPNQYTDDLFDGLNCTNFDTVLDERSKMSTFIELLNVISYSIIVIGIAFNILNLIVLLKSKLNESPYTYLTMLAFSDLGAISMVGVEKIRQIIEDNSFGSSSSHALGSIINYSHLYVAAGINIFLSSSMYITLALTIERFIFVHSPFKAMSICRRSIARRVCAVIFIFSFLRSIYLPLMYKPNCLRGFDQKKNRVLDIYEFLISLAIPYLIILVANISLIRSLKKQNNLMSVSYSLTNNIGMLNRQVAAATLANIADEFHNFSAQQPPIPQSNLVNSFKNKFKPRLIRISASLKTQSTRQDLDSPIKSQNNSNQSQSTDKKIILARNRSTISLNQNQEETLPLSARNSNPEAVPLRYSNTLSNLYTASSSSPTKTTPVDPTNSPNQPTTSGNKPQGRLNRRINSTTSQLTNATTVSGQTSNSIYSSSSPTQQPHPSPPHLKLNTLYRKTTNAREIRNQKKLTTTLIIILCLLLVCYLPSFLFEESLANAIFGNHEQPAKPDTHLVVKIKSIGYRISFLLIYINCSANFLIYCFCNKKFKNSLKVLVKKSCLNRKFQRLKFYVKQNPCLCCLRSASFFKSPGSNSNNIVMYQPTLVYNPTSPTAKSTIIKANKFKHSNNSNNSNLEGGVSSNDVECGFKRTMHE